MLDQRLNLIEVDNTDFFKFQILNNDNSDIFHSFFMLIIYIVVSHSNTFICPYLTYCKIEHLLDTIIALFTMVFAQRSYTRNLQININLSFEAFSLSFINSVLFVHVIRLVLHCRLVYTNYKTFVLIKETSTSDDSSTS